MKYSDKLKDPRWQKKRLEIMEHDEWACKRCMDDESTLHVHHLSYEKGKDPWEYDNENFLTLCESCHEHEFNSRADYEKMLLHTLKQRGFLADDIFRIVQGLLNFKPQNAIEVVASAYEMAFGDPDVQAYLIELMFEKTAEKIRKKQNAAHENHQA